MAKKRKKDRDKEEEEYEFRPPEFKEKEFLTKELRDTRTALFTIGYAVLFGVVAAGIMAISPNLAGVSFLGGVTGLFTLRFYYTYLKIDTTGFTRRNWVGNMGTFFFTFLAIWVLLINVPFLDLTNPTVDKVIVWVDDGVEIHGIEYKKVEAIAGFAWVPMNVNDSLDSLIHASTSYKINITAHVADSGGISYANMAIGSQESGYSPMNPVGKNRYEYKITGNTLNPSTGLRFFIHAGDKHGNDYIFMPDRPIPVAA